MVGRTPQTGTRANPGPIRRSPLLGRSIGAPDGSGGHRDSFCAVAQPGGLRWACRLCRSGYRRRPVPPPGS